MRSSVSRLAFAVGLFFSLSLAWPASPYAATVTDLGDSASPGQLRSLINAAAPGDTIIIPAGTITLNPALGQMTISKSLIIQGTGRDVTFIDGGKHDRVFNVSSSAATVTISNVTIQNGAPAVSGGGAILNVGTLTLANAAVSGSSVSGVSALGGGIFNGATGVLTLTNVVVGCQSPGCKTGNTADAGGGIYNAFGGVVTLINVTLGGNDTTGHSEGGGLFNKGTATLTNVTVSDNKSGVAGGGIFTTGPATLTNVTVSGNTGDAGGGGIFSCGSGALDCSDTPGSALTTLINVTIAGNSGGRGAGGGILNTGALPPSLTNVIVSGNTADGGGANCSGPISSLGHNLDSGATCGLAGSGDLSNTNPNLGPLQNNGGLTFTHALLAGSPAIDAGTNAGCPPTDQRGVARPQGAACDIGAYESASSPTLTLSLNQPIFHSGNVLHLGLTAQNPLPAFNADFYFGILLPDQVTVCFITSLSPLGAMCVPVSAGAQTFPPLAANVQVPQSLNVTVPDLMVFAFGGGEPPGGYLVFALLTPPGAFADGVINPGDFFAVGVQPFSFSP